MLAFLLLLSLGLADVVHTDEECQAPTDKGKACKKKCCGTTKDEGRAGCEWSPKEGLCMAVKPEMEMCDVVADTVCASFCQVEGECCPEDHVFSGADLMCCEGVVTGEAPEQVCNYKAPKLETCVDVTEDVCDNLCQKPDGDCCPDMSIYTTDGVNYSCCEGEVTYDGEGQPVCNYAPDCALITDPCNCLGLCGWSSSAEPAVCKLGSNTNCVECESQSACIKSDCEESFCPSQYDEMRTCQCTAECYQYENCCDDIKSCRTEYCTMPEVAEVIGTGETREGHGYENAFNGMVDDGMESDEADSSVGVKLVAASAIKSVKFYPVDNDDAAEGGRLNHAEIQSSDDGTNWDTMATIGPYEIGVGKWFTIQINDEVEHQYYRLHFDGATNGEFGEVGELKFCAPEKRCLGEIRSKTLECMQEDNETDCGDGCVWDYEADCETFEKKKFCNASKHCVWSGVTKECVNMGCDVANNGKKCTKQCCNKRPGNVCFWLPSKSECATVKDFYCPILTVRQECVKMSNRGSGCFWNRDAPKPGGGDGETGACQFVVPPAPSE